MNISVLLLFIYLFRRREGERERNISLWLPLVHPLLGTWPATQAFALTGNQTGDLLVHRPALSPLSHTSQGWIIFVFIQAQGHPVHCQMFSSLLSLYPYSSLPQLWRPKIFLDNAKCSLGERKYSPVETHWVLSL